MPDIRLPRVSASVHRHATWTFWMRVFFEVVVSILLSSSLTIAQRFSTGERSGLLPGQCHSPRNLGSYAAPILDVPGAMSWGAVLLENHPAGHIWKKLDLGRWVISFFRCIIEAAVFFITS